MKLLFVIFLFYFILRIDCKRKEVSYSVLLSRSEIEDLKEALIQSEIGTLIAKNKHFLLHSLTGEKEHFTGEEFDKIVNELSTRSSFNIPSVLRTFIALREFSDVGSDSEILIELLKKLKNQTISLEEMRKLVQIFYEAAKRERENEKKEKITPRPQEEVKDSNPLPGIPENEAAIFDKLLTQMDEEVGLQFDNSTEELTEEEPEETEEEPEETEDISSFDIPQEPQEKSGLINIDMYKMHQLNLNVDTLMKRFNVLFKERAYLVQGEMRPRDLEYLIWTKDDQVQALLYKDAISDSQYFTRNKGGTEEYQVALLGLENIRRKKDIEISGIEDQVYISIPFVIDPVIVVPRFDLQQPPKMEFKLSGTATMTLDKRRAGFGRDTTLDTLKLDPFSEGAIQYHPSISAIPRRKLARKVFQILNDVGIENFLKKVMTDAVKISNILN